MDGEIGVMVSEEDWVCNNCINDGHDSAEGCTEGQ